jgi:hypothetical protein
VLKSGIGIQATDHSFVIISEQKKTSFDQYISFLITATGMQRNGTRGIKPSIGVFNLSDGTGPPKIWDPNFLRACI